MELAFLPAGITAELPGPLARPSARAAPRAAPRASPGLPAPLAAALPVSLGAVAAAALRHRRRTQNLQRLRRSSSGRDGARGAICRGAEAGRRLPAAALRTRALLKAEAAKAAGGKVKEEDPCEGLEKADPGRSAMRAEWAGPGASLAFEEESGDSGVVRVYSAPSSSGGSWRRLRFNDITDQSVVLLDEGGKPNYSALAFGYLKTLAAVGHCTAKALGRGKGEPLRVLVIGVGGGALPGWFAQSGAIVDAVELDGAVLRAATQGMGMPAEALRPDGSAEELVADSAQQGRTAGSEHVYCCDGAEFVLAAAASGLHYDTVIVDCFDGRGKTPPVFYSEEFSKALGSIAECAVANLTCPVDMWEDAHEFNAPEAGKLVKRWRGGFGDNAGAWTVRVAEGINIVPAVTKYGIPPTEFLQLPAQEALAAGLFQFDPARRVAFRRKDW